MAPIPRMSCLHGRILRLVGSYDPDVARASILNLISAGRLSPGQRLVASHRGARHSAEVIADGAIRIDGGESFKSPSSAAGSITGHNTNGWQFWRTESGERLANLRSLDE